MNWCHQNYWKQHEQAWVLGCYPQWGQNYWKMVQSEIEIVEPEVELELIVVGTGCIEPVNEHQMIGDSGSYWHNALVHCT